ncbi:MAG TPA: hypothetical protein VFV66_01790, partial [Nonomuraea sp.]|nr:hypothetical protein [Nonomuraea sp.]
TRVITLATCDLPADRHAYAPLLREDRALRLPGAPVAPWTDVETAAASPPTGSTAGTTTPTPACCWRRSGSTAR